MKHILFIIITMCSISTYGQEKNQTIQRKGFVIGVGVGAGVVTMADSNLEDQFEEGYGALSMPNLKLGWMVNDRLAILATVPGVVYKLDGKDRSFDAIMPSVQYWVKDRLWINGGVGLAMDFQASSEEGAKDDKWNTGCAVAISSGYELLQKRSFALDVNAQVQMGRTYLDNDINRDVVALTLGVGFTWY